VPADPSPVSLVASYRSRKQTRWKERAVGDPSGSKVCTSVWSGIRRRCENDLGATEYFGLPYYARWITGAAKALVDEKHITVDELSAKIDEVRERLEAKKK
jgi:Nitrile hydratase beta subunit